MKKAILFIVLIVLIIASGIFLKNKKVIAPTEEIKVLPVVEEKIEGRNCFVYKHEATKDEPYKVSETIDINVSGSVVTGTKKGTQAGPDMTNGYEGSLKGILDKDVMNVVFSYVVEGSANKEKEIYLVKKDILEKLRYPLIEGKGILLPDTTKDFKILNYVKVDCKNGDVLANNIKPIQLCFYKSTKTKSSFNDVSWLRLNLSGEKVTGEFNYLPAEKDKKTGTFEGVVGAVDKMAMARTADVWWSSMAEGMQNKEQLRIVFGEGNAEVAFGEMVDRGDGVYVYKDINKVSYGQSMNDVSCDTLNN